MKGKREQNIRLTSTILTEIDTSGWSTIFQPCLVGATVFFDITCNQYCIKCLAENTTQQRQVSNQGFYSPCPEVIKLFSCSTQLSMKCKLFINTETVQINTKPTIVGILIFMSRINFNLSRAEQEKKVL